MNETTTSIWPSDEPPPHPPPVRGRGTSTSPVQYRGYHVSVPRHPGRAEETPTTALGASLGPVYWTGHPRGALPPPRGPT